MFALSGWSKTPSIGSSTGRRWELRESSRGERWEVKGEREMGRKGYIKIFGLS